MVQTLDDTTYVVYNGYRKKVITMTYSDAEWEVLQVLWADSEMTLSQICRALREKGFRWSTNNVQTFLTRLEKKGAVENLRHLNPHVYHVLAVQEDCQRQELRKMRDKVFNGSVSRMTSAFLGNPEITREELLELRQKLEEALRDREAGER